MSVCKATHCPCGATCPLQVSLKRIGGIFYNLESERTYANFAVTSNLGHDLTI